MGSCRRVRLTIQSSHRHNSIVLDGPQAYLCASKWFGFASTVRCANNPPPPKGNINNYVRSPTATTFHRFFKSKSDVRTLQTFRTGMAVPVSSQYDMPALAEIEPRRAGLQRAISLLHGSLPTSSW
jgi:hypothetical protein